MSDENNARPNFLGWPKNYRTLDDFARGAYAGIFAGLIIGALVVALAWAMVATS